MNALIIYIVASVVSLGVFYAAYISLLRKEPLFRFNRIYLLSALILSYLIPLITLLPDAFLFISDKTTAAGFMNAITLSPVVITATAGKMSSLPAILAYIYLAGMVYFAARLILRVLSIYNLSKKANRDEREDSLILWSEDNIPPFSFFRKMYLPASLKDTPHVNEVIRHEQVHINSLHSFDIVFAQIMQIICWVNPFIPLIERFLREIHEFEADKAIIHAGTDPVTYTKILFAQDKTALAVVLGNNFNYSLIKRRLTMFYKKNTRFARLKAMVVLPVAVIVVMMYAIGCQQSNLKPVSENEDSVKVNSNKVMLVKDSLGREVGTATVITDSAIPVPPPPPPPPPPSPSQKSASNTDVYKIAETMPQFPGGDAARVTYMIENLKYPETAKNKGLQGTVYVSFVVEKDGRITNTKVIKGVESSLDAEAFRVVSAMPKWKPGTDKGKPVRVQFNMPIQFKLS